jgi:hypothetical protein
MSAKKQDWVALEKIDPEVRILKALHLALNGKRVPEIARETGIAARSLNSIRRDGPFAHRNKRDSTA